MWLFLAFLSVPLIEIALFINVGGAIGLWPTLGIVVLTAILGTWLVRSQGMMALGQVQSSFRQLNDPTEPLAHGAMILFSGALLLTPGFFTDAVGFALLVPGIRSAVFRWMSARVSVSQVHMGTADARYSRTRPGRDDVIDGDFTDVTTGDKPNPPHDLPRH
ncbi:MAG: FxsA family protein [Brevirhabdus sp.]